MTNPPPRGHLAVSDQLLLCPGCGETSGTHVDTAYISARREDRLPDEIHVHAVTGEVTHGGPVAPVGAQVGSGRRHRIALTGWCEHCQGEFAIIFTQHKGETYVETQIINTATFYETGKNAPL